MRRRASAIVVTQAISPLVAMLAALIVALILLSAPVKAQKTAAEETTVLAADPANTQVEAKTDNVSVEVDNGKVSAKTSNVSTSNKTTSQQSSLTVQQNQADEGSGSQANTGDVNTAAQNSNNFRIVIRDSNGTQVESQSAKVDTTDDFIVDENSGIYELEATVRPENGSTFSVTVEDCRGTDTSTCENPQELDSIDESDDDGLLKFTTTGDRFRVSYTVNFKDSKNNRNNPNNRSKDGNRGAADKQYGKAEVIVKTIPDKGKLAATGGVPLAGLAFLALVSVGLGLSILRFAIRRDP